MPCSRRPGRMARACRPPAKAGPEGLVDEPVALDAALAVESIRYDIKPEVSLAALPPAGVATMSVRFVGDDEVGRSETLLQASRYRPLAHRRRPLNGCAAKCFQPLLVVADHS